MSSWLMVSAFKTGPLAMGVRGIFRRLSPFRYFRLGGTPSPDFESMETWKNKEQYMFRKLLLVGAAIAMPVSIVAVSGGMAGASNPHTAATDSVACKDITGTLTFSPKIDAKGYTSGHISTKISATVTGCTVTGSTPITITKGTIAGTLVGATGTKTKPDGQCTGLGKGGSEIGNLTTTWTASKGGPVPNSVLGVKSNIGGTVGSGSTEHGTFSIPGATKGTSSGSFLGTNKGASDKSQSETKLTYGSVASTCLKSGLTSLAIVQESGKTAVTLG